MKGLRKSSVEKLKCDHDHRVWDENVIMIGGFKVMCKTGGRKVATSCNHDHDFKGNFSIMILKLVQKCWSWSCGKNELTKSMLILVIMIIKIV